MALVLAVEANPWVCAPALPLLGGGEYIGPAPLSNWCVLVLVGRLTETAGMVTVWV